MNNKDKFSDKDVYIEKLQADIKNQTEKLEKIKTQIDDKASQERKEEHEKFINGLEKNLTKAKSRVAELTDAAEDTWKGLTQRADKLRTEISDSFKRFLKK